MFDSYNWVGLWPKEADDNVAAAALREGNATQEQWHQLLNSHDPIAVGIALVRRSVNATPVS